jgi:hypothetical protein
MMMDMEMAVASLKLLFQNLHEERDENFSHHHHHHHHHLGCHVSLTSGTL